jgi:hypothetical protein
MDEEPERIEEGLRRIRPAAAPQDLMERLRAARLEMQPASRLAPRRNLHRASWFAGWRGLAVAAGPAVAMVLLFVWLTPRPPYGPAKIKISDLHGIKANAVQVGHSLMASFDAVAQLPGGEPVRFHCLKWQDDVVIHDDAQGLVISQSTPRVEVVPVRFETY